MLAKYVTPGTVTAVLSVLALIAGLFGKPALQTFLADPDTAQSVLQAVGLVGSLFAGFMQGVKKD